MEQEVYALYGIRDESYLVGIEGGFETEQIVELLATFSSYQLAKNYINDSLLKIANTPYFYPDIKRGKYRFKKESLLRYFDRYEIDKYTIDSSPPHDPAV